MSNKAIIIFALILSVAVSQKSTFYFYSDLSCQNQGGTQVAVVGQCVTWSSTVTTLYLEITGVTSTQASIQLYSDNQCETKSGSPLEITYNQCDLSLGFKVIQGSAMINQASLLALVLLLLSAML